MSLNSRSEPTKIIAARRFPRDREGRPILPRVIKRAPRPGDVHPLTRQHISNFLRYLPVDYVYGLRRVELRGRTSEEIGDPYGYYLNGEKTIVLFSVPPDLWQFPHTTVAYKRLFASTLAV